MESEVEAIFWPVVEFKHCIRVLAPVLFPHCPPGTNVSSGGRDVRDCELVLGGHERMEAVIEVRKKQDWPSREGLH